MSRFRPPRRLHPVAFWLTLVAALWLHGCGFQPRGEAITLSGVASPVLIAGLEPYSPLQREVRRGLQLAGLETTEDRDHAAAVLRIGDHRSRRRVLSVDQRNKVVEYELEESLRFSLHNAAGALVPEQRVRTLRILFNPEDEVLGRNREEDLLREDMRADLVRRLIERLDAQI